jgi:hypothetical protein
MLMRLPFLVLPLLLTVLLPSAAQQPGLHQQQQHMAAMRMVGHQLLLSMGDSHSRVLPIEPQANGYAIRFDTSFALDPDGLVSIVDSVMQMSGIASEYLVEVQQCSTLQVLYSYAVKPSIGPEAVACRSRPLPEDCHTILISLTEPKTVLAAERAQESAPASGLLPIALTIIVMGAIGLTFSIRKRPARTAETGPDPGPLALGSYLFDKRNMTLTRGADRTELTGKEVDLLALLLASVNTTVERDVILHDVWGDEGVYVGRTLDVFVSRLRKKLEADPDVRIVNIRGVGYRLIVGSEGDAMNGG